ncbi:MAG: CDP-alcohol phosphatidyltransferase family protein [Chloroflexia bacterium]|nr:CDP-alcohol phosphatidyltransferase family protein [Chloroflexia bacterium]
MASTQLFEPRELLYPSNMLTIARLLLIPPTFRYLQQPERRREALACLGVAMLTDAIDGPLARARGEVSHLGELLDPVADKILINGTAIILSKTRDFPWWITGLLLFRDLGIIAAALVVIKRRSQITVAASTGKLTTALLTAAALLYVADGPRTGKPALYVAMVPFLLSFFQYGKRFLAVMRNQGA